MINISKVYNRIMYAEYTHFKCLGVVSGHVFEGFIPAPTIEKHVFRSLIVASNFLFVCIKLVEIMTPTFLCSSRSSTNPLPSFSHGIC